MDARGRAVRLVAPAIQLPPSSSAVVSPSGMYPPFTPLFTHSIHTLCSRPLFTSSVHRSRQFFRAPRAPTEKRYWAISNRELSADGLCIENIVCYPNTACCRVDSRGRVGATPPIESVVG